MSAVSATAAPEACRHIDYAGQAYTVCSFDPARSIIKLYQNDADGHPFGSFEALQSMLETRGKMMTFATNGGMYDEAQQPVGLFVENGLVKHPIILGGGWGNFHLLPNGVFYLNPTSAGVMETKAFAASGLKPQFATQSGPMLVIEGAIHPAFLPQSDSLKIRNGVGVTTSGEVVFAKSEGRVRFYDFAVLFRDVLGCPNALFLDGTISSMSIPMWGRQDDSHPMGPIIAVTEPFPTPITLSDMPAEDRRNDQDRP